GPKQVTIHVKCAIHPEERITAFCTTDSTPICAVCASTTHKPHPKEPLDVAAGWARAAIQELLAQPPTDEADMRAAIQRITERMDAMAAGEAAGLAGIQAWGEEVIAAVRARMEALSAELRQTSAELRAALEGQRREMEASIAALDHARSYSR